MARNKTSASVDPLSEHKRYEKVKNLNAGAFGFVQLAKDKLNKGAYVAVKFIPRGEGINEYVEAEIINHRQLLHPHIIQFQEVFLTDQYLGIAMEYANGGDSFEYVRKKGGLQENEARWFFQQLIVALDYCHRKGVVNRDVKLENTLIHWAQKPLLKICDFGYSKDEKYQSAPASRVGTPAYLAPEVILNKKGDTYNGKQSDVWSCGVMLYVTLVGQYPFERPEDKQDPQKLHKMIRRIVQVDYQLPSRVKVSEGCQRRLGRVRKDIDNLRSNMANTPSAREYTGVARTQDLMSKILVAKPEERYSIQEIIEHPWFKQDLPCRALRMNDEYLSLSPDGNGFQQLSEIKAVLKAAKQKSQPAPRKKEDDLILEAFQDLSS